VTVWENQEPGALHGSKKGVGWCERKAGRAMQSVYQVSEYVLCFMPHGLHRTQATAKPWRRKNPPYRLRGLDNPGMNTTTSY
jgi:hypothetical protein